MTTDILRELLQACAGDRLVDVRDRALLLLPSLPPGRSSAWRWLMEVKLLRLSTTQM